jgi:hypothetical protein
MEEALRFFRTYEIWLYVILALAGLVYIRKIILAWEDLRRAAFGLERESAQSQLNYSVGMLFVLFIMAVGVFVLVSFVSPAFPDSNPLLTPTMDLLATPTITLVAGETPEDLMEESLSDSTPETVATEQVVGEGCLPDQVMLTEPTEGEEVSGLIVVEGTADTQNFGFYKYEVARPGETVWLTILAGRDIVRNGELGQWDTRSLAPGDYMLRLVVTDNQGESLEPCVIQVRVNNPSAP